MEAAPPAALAGAALRGMASLLGLVVIVIGLYFSVRTFLIIRDTVRDPTGAQETFAQWNEALGGDKLEIRFEGDLVPLAPILGLVAVGGGCVLMCWLSLGIMVAGAKIISWSTGDREAVRQILREVLGSRVRAGQ
jgi:hypothetical protein